MEQNHLMKAWNFETLSGVPARHCLLRFLEYGPLRVLSYLSAIFIYAMSIDYAMS